MKELTKTEEILLLAIWKLEDEAYGVKIRRYVSNVIKKEFTYGNLYSVLNQLVKKKYVTKRDGEIIPERRGRRRIYYTVTAEGLEALKSAQEMHDMMWAGIPKYAFDRSR